MPETLTDHEKAALRDALEDFVDEYSADAMDQTVLYAAVAKIITTRKLDRPTINIADCLFEGVHPPAISFHCDTLDDFTAIINGFPADLEWRPQTAGLESDYLVADHNGFRVTVWPPRRLAQAPAAPRPNGALLLLDQVRRG